MLFQRINGGQNLISSDWCRVRPHHKLTDQSESISHDLDPFWSAETLFTAVSTKICKTRQDEEAEREREDSDVDFEASRRSTRVQSKSTIRSALFLAKH